MTTTRKGCRRDTVDDRHKDEQVDGVDVEQAQHRAPKGPQGDETVEDRGFAH
jgi:hypothetical protein